MILTKYMKTYKTKYANLYFNCTQISMIELKMVESVV